MVDVGPVLLITDWLSRFSCGVMIVMLLSLLTVPELPTVTLVPAEMLTGPPLRLRVAALEPVFKKVNV